MKYRFLGYDEMSYQNEEIYQIVGLLPKNFQVRN